MSSKNSSLSTSHAVALSSLDPATTYHYRVKSVDAVGNETFSDDHTFTTLAPSQNIGSTASSSNNTQISAPDAISTLSIGGYDQSSVELIWHTIGDNADISLKYDVRYSTSPITSDNYANATEAQLTPIYHGDLDPQGTGRTYIVAGLSQNTTYYFAIQSRHQTSDWSAESNVVSTKTTGGTSINTENSTQGGGANITSSGSTSSSGGGSSATSGSYGGGSGGNVGSSFEPTTLKAEPADNQIVFEWNNPGEANFVRTVLMRKEGSYPKSPTDGQTLYEGRGQTFTDTNVTNGKTYYYALYSYNHSKTYSPPVWVSLAPKADNTQIKFNENGSLISFSPTLHFTRVYKRGDKNVEVEHLQEILTLENVSFPEKLITGYFGSYTENSLKQFQKKHGLIQSGIVDASTQAKLNSMSHHEVKLETPGDFIIFDTDQKLGDQGEVVKDLQEFLEYEGSYGGKITGIFDSATKKAVMAFQKKYNIDPVSGYVGYKTRHRMQQLTGF